MADNSDFHAALIRGLMQPVAWPEPVEDIQRIETHISTVLLAGEFAYKIKKPVDLGFLDFSTLERRRYFCAEELRLNGRLAPHIYLDVTPITGTLERPRMGGEGDAIDYAVKMRRFPPDALLSNHLQLLSPQLMDEIAEIVADFHAHIAVATPDAEFGSAAAVIAPMLENFRQIKALPEESGVLARLEMWTRERHRALRETLEMRHAGGFIRECHGDMHLGNIALVEGKVLIFDGIEFNPSLRWIDTINEIAFLAMDLDEKGRSDLAYCFLNGYLQRSGDYEGLVLLRFYQAYRAMVRAKVAAIRLGQPDLPAEEKAATLKDYRAYVAQAEGYTRPARPALIITHGVSGSGKSVATRPLMGTLPAIRVRSDVERKRLAGLGEGARTGSAPAGGLYSAVASDRTYARLLELAEAILRAGYVVIVDATFLQQRRRRPFQELSIRLDVPFVILDFQAPEEVLRARVQQRLSVGTDPSEAGLEVLEMQLATQEPLAPSEQAAAIRVTPEQPLEPGVLQQRLFRSPPASA